MANLDPAKTAGAIVIAAVVALAVLRKSFGSVNIRIGD